MTTSIIRLSVHLGLGLKAAVTVYKCTIIQIQPIRIGKKVYGRSEGGAKEKGLLTGQFITDYIHVLPHIS